MECGYSCAGKYEYGGAPCYGTFECSGLALWYRSRPLLRVLRLLQALGNTVCSPLSLVAQASPVSVVAITLGITLRRMDIAGH